LDTVNQLVYELAYNMVLFATAIAIEFNAILINAALWVYMLTGWIVDTLFVPVITVFQESFIGIVGSMLTVAVMVLGIQKLVAHFFELDLVDMRRIFMWTIVAGWMFNFGPDLYEGIEAARLEMSSYFYDVFFTEADTNSASIDGLSYMDGSANTTFLSAPLTDQFTLVTTYVQGLDGMDVAVAYLAATDCDFLYWSGCTPNPFGNLPASWYAAGGYFDVNTSPLYYGSFSPLERMASLEAAQIGFRHAIYAQTISLFALMESIVRLLLTSAFGIAFASTFIGVLFAYFKFTETVAIQTFVVVRSLFIQSLLNSLFSAMIISFVVISTSTNNAFLVAGIGLAAFVMAIILIINASAALMSAINGMWDSMASIAPSMGAAGQLTDAIGTTATAAAIGLTTGNVLAAAGALGGSKAAQGAYYAGQHLDDDTWLNDAIGDFGAGAALSAGGMAGAIGGLAYTSKTDGLGWSDDEDDDPTMTQEAVLIDDEDDDLAGALERVDGPVALPPDVPNPVVGKDKRDLNGASDVSAATMQALDETQDQYGRLINTVGQLATYKGDEEGLYNAARENNPDVSFDEINDLVDDAYDEVTQGGLYPSR
ncbi:MAG: hypothetical protein AAF125_18520, partial [Chloroflexota bacterium]